ncbi:MAG: hypothetical protein WC291_07415 [Thermodesulfovibrionales bacterium]
MKKELFQLSGFPIPDVAAMSYGDTFIKWRWRNDMRADLSEDRGLLTGGRGDFPVKVYSIMKPFIKQHY